MSFLSGLLIFLIIAGLTAAMVTNYLGLYQIPGQCATMCKACQSDDEPAAKDKPDQTTSMHYMMF
jgi:hypothetical protein